MLLAGASTTTRLVSVPCQRFGLALSWTRAPFMLPGRSRNLPSASLEPSKKGNIDTLTSRSSLFATITSTGVCSATYATSGALRSSNTSYGLGMKLHCQLSALPQPSSTPYNRTYRIQAPPLTGSRPDLVSHAVADRTGTTISIFQLPSTNRRRTKSICVMSAGLLRSVGEFSAITGSKTY